MKEIKILAENLIFEDTEEIENEEVNIENIDNIEDIPLAPVSHEKDEYGGEEK